MTNPFDNLDAEYEGLDRWIRGKCTQEEATYLAHRVATDPSMRKQLRLSQLLRHCFQERREEVANILARKRQEAATTERGVSRGYPPGALPDGSARSDSDEHAQSPPEPAAGGRE